MSCLLLWANLKTTYRVVTEFLETSESLQNTLGLRQLPHYSTLKYCVDRSGTLAIVDAMLTELALMESE